MAGRYIQETAKDIEKGFEQAGEDPGNVMREDLHDARVLADRLVEEGDGQQAEAQESLDKLADALNGLGEVLGSRRK
jgi:hypothetical protein